MRYGVALAVCLALSGTPYANAAPPAHPSHIVFRIADAQIRESSSLVEGTTSPGLFYTANDSGDGPFVYVIDPTGRLLGTTTLSGVNPVDVEAMAIGADGSLVVGDIGDNDATRSDVRIYRLEQPVAGDHTVTPDAVTLRYADGPHNAESLLYDARSGRVFVVDKEALGRVYESPRHVFSRAAATLRPVAAAPSFATDATFLPGHRAAVIRTYRQALVYRYPSWRFVTAFRLPHQQQGESITSVGGDIIWVGSEGTDSPVWQVRLPPAAARLVGSRPATGRGNGASSPPARSGSDAGGPGRVETKPASGEIDAAADASGSDVSTVVGVGTGVLVVVLAAIVLVLVVGGVRLSRRRRPKPPPPTPIDPPRV